MEGMVVRMVWNYTLAILYFYKSILKHKLKNTNNKCLLDAHLWQWNFHAFIQPKRGVTIIISILHMTKLRFTIALNNLPKITLCKWKSHNSGQMGAMHPTKGLVRAQREQGPRFKPLPLPPSGGKLHKR